MSAQIDLDSVSNLKHRAILKALQETDLSQQEIYTRLSINRSMLHYVANKYLGKEYLPQRQQRLQLLELSQATDNSASPSDDDEVTVLALPQPEDAAPSTEGSHQEPTVHGNCANSSSSNGGYDIVALTRDQLSRTQRTIFDFMENHYDAHDRMPNLKDIYEPMESAGLQGHSFSTVSIVRRAWITAHTSRLLASSQNHTPKTPIIRTPQTAPAPKAPTTSQAAAPLVHLSAEYAGFKISWECSSQEREDSISKVLTTLKSLSGE